MKHHGNVTKINGAEIEPVDVITFGSPCQDMSVAGKRKGMKHAEQGDKETTRSGLFYEAIRIIKEMREATNNEYPKYAVYENVPGAFSSNKGHDFHAVLEALCSVSDNAVSIPKPYDKRKPDKLVWDKAGEIVGDSYSIAWRTLDAQYWGVPQRRKRIYLVADFTGGRAREILFKPDRLPRNLPQGDETWQGAAADAVGSVDGSVGVECVKKSAQHEPVIALQANGIDRADTAGCNGCGWRENESYTLNTVDRHAVCFDRATFNQGINAQYDFEVSQEGVVSTVVAKDPSGVCYDAREKGDGETVLFEPRSPDGEPRVYDDICPKPPRRYIIRRLTPTECARLQGFPDWWSKLAPYNPADAEFWEEVRKTYAEINGKKYKPVKDIKKWYDKLHTDSAEYKAYGNGLALPCAEFVIRGIAEHGAKTLGSLFDGIGGFPLAGTLNGITPLWASEVEPYPIAVTKSRFEEED